MERAPTEKGEEGEEELMFAEVKSRSTPEFETSKNRKLPTYHSHESKRKTPSFDSFKRHETEPRWHVSEVRRAVMGAFERSYVDTLTKPLTTRTHLPDRVVLDLKEPPKPDKFYMFELGGIRHAVRVTRDGFFEIYEVEDV